MRVILILSLFLLASCNPSEDKKHYENASLLKHVEGNVVLENYFFHPLEEERVVAISSKEYLKSNGQLSSYSFQPVYPKQDSGKWQIQLEAASYKLEKNTLISSAELESGETSYVLYDLIGGQRVIEYTYDKFEVLFSDENEKRFLGFNSKNAMDLSVSKSDFTPNTFGFLNYANASGKINSLRIEAVDAMWLNIFDVTNPVIELLPIKENGLSLNSGKTLYFTGIDGHTPSEVNFDIQFTYYTTDTYKPTSLTLQVRDDQFKVADNFNNSVFKLESF